ncbi:nuclear transport factor 2 family protein [Kocuria sp. CPCC 205268]|uniref:YybH family protein n=1 Tax=Kocuria oxytropis TaxID=3058913 RepID=UPI0034D6E7BC
MAASDLDQVIEEYHQAISAVARGDAGPQKRLFSRRDDVTLATPIGPPIRGRHAVEEAFDRVVAQLRDGELLSAENISRVATDEMAYIVELEHSRGKVGGSEETASWSLRSTTVFRREDGEWKVCHRHADTVTESRPMASILHRDSSASDG